MIANDIVALHRKVGSRIKYWLEMLVSGEWRPLHDTPLDWVGVNQLRRYYESKVSHVRFRAASSRIRA
jgi:hypothetical protein